MRNAKTDLLRMLQKAFKKALQKNDPEGFKASKKQDASRRDFLRKTFNKKFLQLFIIAQH